MAEGEMRKIRLLPLVVIWLTAVLAALVMASAFLTGWPPPGPSPELRSYFKQLEAYKQQALQKNVEYDLERSRQTAEYYEGLARMYEDLAEDAESRASSVTPTGYPSIDEALEPLRDYTDSATHYRAQAAHYRALASSN